MTNFKIGDKIRLTNILGPDWHLWGIIANILEHPTDPTKPLTYHVIRTDSEFNTIDLNDSNYFLAHHMELIERLLPSVSCECGNASNPIGQGHSMWCQMFKAEF